MNQGLKRKLAGGAAGLALLAGAGGAYAVSRGTSGDRQTFLNDVAKRLNVSPEQLKAAFAGALSDRLDADVAAGRLTRAQADAIKQEMGAHGGLPFLPPGRFGGAPPRLTGPPPPGGPPPLAGPPPPGPPPPFPGGPPPGAPRPPGPIGAGLDAAAKYLGLTVVQLHAQLEAGKSLAQVAGERKKPVDGLKSAIESAVKSDLDKAVTGKRLTQQQEDRILAGLHARLDNIVNRKPGDRPPGFRFRGRMRGPHW